MEENCVLAIENGCEFTPIHLHAMSKVSDDDLDCVLAGSFGDSIGRAEYSGTSVEYLKSIKSSIRNYGGILRHDYAKLTKKNVEKDIEEYHLLFPQDKKYQQYELDLQIHYMRRMLNPCMGIIDKKIPLYQMFSSPEVISYIWSIHPSKRNNLVYKYIIDEYAPELKEVPWARTGLKYTENEGIPDLYKKQHHNYGEMIITYFLEDIEVRIKDNDILAKQLFNYKGLLKLIQNIKNYPMDGKHIYEERLLWISLVLDFINKNQISLNIPEYKPGIAEGFKSEIEYKYRFFLAKG
jgi:asparagine synthase (glutamine-hydrolysing)